MATVWALAQAALGETDQAEATEAELAPLTSSVRVVPVAVAPVVPEAREDLAAQEAGARRLTGPVSGLATGRARIRRSGQ